MIEAVKAAETAKKKAELTKKTEKADRKVDNLSKSLDSERRRGLSTTNTRIDLEYAARESERLHSELDKLK